MCAPIFAFRPRINERWQIDAISTCFPNGMRQLAASKTLLVNAEHVTMFHIVVSAILKRRNRRLLTS